MEKYIFKNNMNHNKLKINKDVVFKTDNSVFSVILNRPDSLNSLTTEMMHNIRDFLISSRENNDCKAILMYGAGTRGFCAGGDVKFMAESARDKNYDAAMDFLKIEYETDLLIHQYPKPVIVIADGITMGGGLGLSVGADIMLATETSVMAMPETRIGFFPDIGATGWMFAKCREGYPEFLGITGYTLKGYECVRVGPATHYIKSGNINAIVHIFKTAAIEDSSGKEQAANELLSLITQFFVEDNSANYELDNWVRSNFHYIDDLNVLMNNLSDCKSHNSYCDETVARMSQCSPSAMALSLMLLRANKDLPMENVFTHDLAAAEYMLRHHDFYEGVRARLINKDNCPEWEPASADKVSLNFKL